jgi:excisionase family DNA binding protein
MITEQTQDTKKPQLFTIDETAEILGCGRTHVYKLLKRKELKALKLGKLIRVTGSSIQEFISTLPEYVN